MPTAYDKDFDFNGCENEDSRLKNINFSILTFY